jgi:hypothetical protein
LRTLAWTETSRAETGSSRIKDLGLHQQGPGDADALALPARELAGVAPGKRPGDSSIAARTWRRCALHATRRSRNVAAEDERLAENLRDGHARVEGAGTVLEDGLDLAAEVPERPAGESA